MPKPIRTQPVFDAQVAIAVVRFWHVDWGGCRRCRFGRRGIVPCLARLDTDRAARVPAIEPGRRHLGEMDWQRGCSIDRSVLHLPGGAEASRDVLARDCNDHTPGEPSGESGRARIRAFIQRLGSSPWFVRPDVVDRRRRILRFGRFRPLLPGRPWANAAGPMGVQTGEWHEYRRRGDRASTAVAQRTVPICGPKIESESEREARRRCSRATTSLMSSADEAGSRDRVVNTLRHSNGLASFSLTAELLNRWNLVRTRYVS